MSKNDKKEIKQRDFKGVWIPKEIYLNEELNWTEKILLIEIDSLDNEKGCFASNEYFANFIGKSKVYISNCISKLKDKNYIYQESFDGRNRVLRSNYAFGVKDKTALNNSLRQHKDLVKGSPNEKFKGGKSETPGTSKDKAQKNPSNNTYNNTFIEEEEGNLSTKNISQKTLSLFKQVYQRPIKKYELKLILKYDLPDEVIRKAIELTGTYNGQTLAYLLNILDKWERKGITTLEGVKAEIDQFKRSESSEETYEDYLKKGYR